MIRDATEADLPELRRIEWAAGEVFARVGMAAVARDEPASVATLREFQRAGRAWVWADELDHPVAYLVLAVVDGAAHVEQVSVHPDHAHRRIGRALIEHAARWARDRALAALTLTTFVEVEWNGPYYLRLGFRYLTAAEQTPGLRAIRAQERERGLDRWPRACMRVELADWKFD
ncbi:GNAT family N-acetyltransferase [Nocardia callitridis]|uniref:GNAT family N-acetyltransferase n=1 Tax=Nocardia callitridis TaxID=648753 RepID=A0ABP9L317_9NOCA